MKTIVLTGGPCSGKTTILDFLKNKYQGQVVLVPEAATMLLSSGFPVPGKDVSWSPAWQQAFQSAILPLQIHLEAAYRLIAEEKGAEIMICDRGGLDGAAYTPGGVDAFCQQFQVSKDEILASYDAIIHLESLATGKPELYGNTNNEQRFEALAEAQDLELKTRKVWDSHSAYHFISVGDGIQVTIDAVEEILSTLV